MIVLVGFMGAGKTTVGRALARLAGLPFIDIDETIERGSLNTIAEIFEADGEPAFRARERDQIAATLAGEDAIVAVGGGALDDPRTRTDLEWHDVVHLDVPFAEAMRRVGGDMGRPMLSRHDPKELYDDRRRHYETVARLTLSTDGRRPDEIAEEIAAELALGVSPDVPRLVVATQPPYDVVVGEELLPRLDEFIPELPDAEKALLVTHPSLRGIAGPALAPLQRLGLHVHVIEVPEGEDAKSVASAERVFEACAQAELHRRDLVVAVGGGVVTDLAGFVASTYNRGMPVVHVPTTLLAQVDAAVGGKTGVNLVAGKNLVGTIHQPRLVVCDVTTLRTLAEEELVSGLAEVAKYGFIEQPDILDLLLRERVPLLDRDPKTLRDVVARSVEVKAAIVAIDEREMGVREVLNYGHTFAHAFEHASRYKLRHGHAVALGMMAAAYLAHDLRRIDADVVDRHRTVLEALGLPARATFDPGVLEQAWMRDKKYRGGVRFVLLSALGRAEPGVRVERPVVARALERLAG